MSEQITITVTDGQGLGQVRLLHPVKNTLLDTLREGGIILPSLCANMGKCGRCLVRFKGYTPLPTQTDRALIAPGKLREGIRLACMARPVRDCRIETAFVKEGTGSIITASAFPAEEAGFISRPVGQTPCRETLIAVDLGTTTIAMQLLNGESLEVVSTYTCQNPQGSYGMDVIERIRAGCEGKASVLKQLVREAVWEGVIELLHAAGEKGLYKPGLISIAGNTAMGHLFMGYPMDSLGKSPFTPVNIKMIDFLWNGIRTVLVPGISAFIGGDITAGLLLCGLHKNESWLFLDLGTNAEMVLVRGNRMFATAAAAGPAFEGRSQPGSMRIHAVAKLLKQGMMDETGLLKEPYFEQGIVIDDIFIGQKDIRDIQMAKAAVRAGIHFLKEKSGLEEYGGIKRVYLAGGFGFHLNKGEAVRIGLIPRELENRIITVGNTSLAGAGFYGRKIAQGCYDSKSTDYITEGCQIFNLALEENFEGRYIKYLDFDKESI